MDPPFIAEAEAHSTWAHNDHSPASFSPLPWNTVALEDPWSMSGGPSSCTATDSPVSPLAMSSDSVDPTHRLDGDHQLPPSIVLQPSFFRTQASLVMLPRASEINTSHQNHPIALSMITATPIESTQANEVDFQSQEPKSSVPKAPPRPSSWSMTNILQTFIDWGIAPFLKGALRTVISLTNEWILWCLRSLLSYVLAMILLALLFHLTFHYAIPALIAMLMNNIKQLFHSYVETVNPRTWCHTFFGIQSLCSLGSYPFGNYSINSHLFGGHSIGNYSLVHYWFGDHSFSSFTFGDYNLSDLSFPFRQVQHYLVERKYTPPMINLAPTLNITLETLIALYAGLELSSFPLASCQVLNCLEMWNSSSYLHLKVAESAHLEMGVFSLVYELSE